MCLTFPEKLHTLSITLRQQTSSTVISYERFPIRNTGVNTYKCGDFSKFVCVHPRLKTVTTFTVQRRVDFHISALRKTLHFEKLGSIYMYIMFAVKYYRSILAFLIRVHRNSVSFILALYIYKFS